jgi:hypothetical protein
MAAAGLMLVVVAGTHNKPAHCRCESAASRRSWRTSVTWRACHSSRPRQSDHWLS